MENKKTILWGLGLIAALSVLSLGAEGLAGATGQTLLMTVLKKGTVYALLVVSMNLLNGFTGLFSLGQAGFMLIGAYTYAILTIPVAKRAGVYQYYDGGLVQFSIPEALSGILGETVGSVAGMVVTLLICGLLAAFFGWLIGLPVLRLKSDYLAIATLGFAEIIRTFIQYESFAPLTNGSNTLRQYPTFKHLYPYVIVVGLCILFLVLLVNSTYGRAFKAIRDDEIAAEAMGINVKYYKTLAMVISAAICSIAGSIQAAFATMVSPELFSSTKSIQIFSIVVIGGRMSIKGMILGGCLMTILPEVFHSVKDVVGLSFDPWNILYGLLLVVMMRVRPQGIWGRKEKDEG